MRLGSFKLCNFILEYFSVHQLIVFVNWNCFLEVYPLGDQAYSTGYSTDVRVLEDKDATKGILEWKYLSTQEFGFVHLRLESTEICNASDQVILNC